MDGNVFCSGIPLIGPINIADRLYFQRAVSLRSLALGEYQIGRLTGKATVNLGYPVLDEQEMVQAVVFVALDLAWFNQLAAGFHLPTGAVLTVIDRNGAVLAHYPDAELWVGQALGGAPIIETVLQRREGTTTTRGIDSVPRLYGFTPLGGSTSDTYVSIGLPMDMVKAAARRTIISNLAGVALVTLLAFVAARLGAETLVHRPVTRLLTATQQQSAHDPLTGLFSRSLFVHYLQAAMARAAHGNERLAVLDVDLDHFQRINERFGHPGGDQVLTLVGQRLSTCVRRGDTVARFGSDEFVILLERLTGPGDAEQVAQRILDSLRAPFLYEGHKVSVSTSIGIAVSDPDHIEENDLLASANRALHRAKAAGRARYVLFEENDLVMPRTGKVADAGKAG